MKNDEITHAIEFYATYTSTQCRQIISSQTLCLRIKNSKSYTQIQSIYANSGT